MDRIGETMNITNNIAQTKQGSTATTQAEGNTLGKNDFLKLLVTQMKNQDPINPMDGTKFASQLAQFNSVEQLINLNSGIDALAKSQRQLNSGISNTMAASLTGKKVRALSSKVGLTAGEDTTIQFELQDIATDAKIVISDAEGNTVRTEKLGKLGAGKHEWTWDGTSNAGNEAPEGVYAIEIQAHNKEADVQALTFIEGMAQKVRYSANGVELLVNGAYVPLGDVQEIGV